MNFSKCWGDYLRHGAANVRLSLTTFVCPHCHQEGARHRTRESGEEANDDGIPWTCRYECVWCDFHFRITWVRKDDLPSEAVSWGEG